MWTGPNPHWPGWYQGYVVSNFLARMAGWFERTAWTVVQRWYDVEEIS